MAQPKYGEIRITTMSGEGSKIVPLDNLEAALEEAHKIGKGIIEITTSLGTNSPPELVEPETRTCPSKSCPVTFTKNPNKGRVVASARGFAIPESCIQCAGRQITSVAGLLAPLTEKPVEITDLAGADS